MNDTRQFMLKKTLADLDLECLERDAQHVATSALARMHFMKLMCSCQPTRTNPVPWSACEQSVQCKIVHWVTTYPI